MRVMVIEDNPNTANRVRGILEEQGHQVETADNGFEGEAKAAAGSYDMLILDLMLPDRDGVDICRALRRHGINTPILMLTSLAATEQKVEGLRAGADDYLTKPFEPDELMARVEAVARRAQGEDHSKLSFDSIRMDLLKRQVERGDQPIRLTIKEFELLECFLRNPHKVLSKSQIGTRVWGMDYAEDSNVIEVYISRLRKKIDQPFERPVLHTVVGAGYMLSSSPPGS